MFGFSIGAWLRIGAVVALLAGLAWSNNAAYNAGRSAVLDRLQSERISILKDGRRIDEKVFNADDADLCALLGGCELSDDKPR